MTSRTFRNSLKIEKIVFPISIISKFWADAVIIILIDQKNYKNKTFFRIFALALKKLFSNDDILY